MLSYRHAFHAGNFADLLKHLTLVQLLEYLKLKPAPIRYIDTHAGSGLYDLTDAMSVRTGEFNRGVGTVDFSVLPASVKTYASLIAPYLARRQYPGSPLIAAKLLRPQDELRLFELHNTDYPALERLMVKDRRARVYHQDGYESLKALLPVQRARALVFMDPSYELQQEYKQVVETLRDGYARMPHAMFALWYPVVDSKAVSYLVRQISTLAGEKLWHRELQGVVPESGTGMTASGMLVINPPWNLDTTLGPLLTAVSAQFALRSET